MAESTCECKTSSILVFACSGAADVGQMANAAAVEITRRKQGKMYCLAGVAAHLPNMVGAANAADLRVAIDGCFVECARKALEHAGARVDKAVVVTNLGFEKGRTRWTPADLNRLIAASLEGLSVEAAP